MNNLLPWLRRALALATLLIAAILCLQCIDIYLAGNSAANLDQNGVHLTPVYSPSDIALRMRSLAVPLTIWILLVVAILVIQQGKSISPTHTQLTPENRLRLLKNRFASLPEAALKEERLRKRIQLAAAAVIAVFTVFCLCYLLNGANFTSWALEEVMGSMLLHVAPLVALGFATAYVASLFCARSAEREITILKSLTPVSTGCVPDAGKKIPVRPIRLVLYLVAVLFIVLGVMNGGLRDVLVKAINICTECIGLG